MPKGSLKWALWLVFIVASFALMESYSLHDNTSTLSRFVWNVSAGFPLFPWIAGVITGGLAVHFWWGGTVTFAPPDIKKDN